MNEFVITRISVKENQTKIFFNGEEEVFSVRITPDLVMFGKVLGSKVWGLIHGHNLLGFPISIDPQSGNKLLSVKERSREIKIGILLPEWQSVAEKIA